MLSPEERQEIVAEFENYPDKRALTIDAMKIVQNHRGWVSDEALKDISELLEVTLFFPVCLSSPSRNTKNFDSWGLKVTGILT